MSHGPDKQSQGASRVPRRKHYIKRKYQRDFILRICLVTAGAVILSGVLVYLFSGDTMTASYRYSRLTLESTGDAIMPQLLASGAAVLIALVLVTIYVALYLSHKVAGPLYRFEQDLKAVARGDLTQEFRLREDDQLKDLVAELNHLARNLQANVVHLRETVDDLQAQAGGEEWDRQAMAAQIAKLRSDLDRMFKV